MSAPTVPPPVTGKGLVPDAGPDPTRRPGARALLGIGVTLGVLGFAWAGLQLADLASTSTVHASESYDATGTVELVADGPVTVRAASDDAADVVVDRTERSGFAGPTYTSERTGDRLVVTNRCTSWFSSTCRGSLEATLPAGTRVVVSSTNGDVRVTGVTGDTELRSENGDVVATGVGGRLVVGSGNGDLVVRDAGGDLDADASNGTIDVDGVVGSATVRSSNGDVLVAGVAGDVRATNSNGDVTVRGDGTPVALTIETSNGERTIDGPTDPTASRTVEIESSNGDVTYLAP